MPSGSVGWPLDRRNAMVVGVILYCISVQSSLPIRKVVRQTMALYVNG